MYEPQCGTNGCLAWPCAGYHASMTPGAPQRGPGGGGGGWMVAPPRASSPKHPPTRRVRHGVWAPRGVCTHASPGRLMRPLCMGSGSDPCLRCPSPNLDVGRKGADHMMVCYSEGMPGARQTESQSVGRPRQQQQTCVPAGCAYQAACMGMCDRRANKGQLLARDAANSSAARASPRH